MSSATASSRSWDSAGSGFDLDLIVLDHRIRQELIPHPLRCQARGAFVGRRKSHEDLLAGTYLGDIVAERAQRREDGLALRIAQLALGSHQDAGDESVHEERTR